MLKWLSVFSAVLALVCAMASPQVLAGEKKPKIMTVQFAVQDYAAWRPVFDQAEPLRAQAGIKNPRLYRSADQPNDLLVIFDVPSKKEGAAWIQSPALREAWSKGGVVGTPIVGFVSFKAMKDK